jgi:hypothetical protein
MLLRFRVSNFRSLREEQELSMVASSLAGFPEGVVHRPDLGLDLLRVAAIYGANAAGKSNVLAALRFLSAAVQDSQRRWRPEAPIPREPFLLDSQSPKAPSRFEIDFLIDAVRYRYGFEVDTERVREEWLYAYPKRRRQLCFHRQGTDGSSFDFGKGFRGNNRSIATLTRKNSLFLSAAAENNHPALSPIYAWLADRLRFSDSENRDARMAFTLELVRGRKREILDLLRTADLGIEDIDLKRPPLDGEVREALRSYGPDAVYRVDLALDRLADLSLELKHRSSDPAGSSLPLEMESRGTQAWLALAGPLTHVLETGAVLCVDELDASLHPRLALEVVRTFQDPGRNPNGAQLLLNTHDTTLLGNLLGGPGLRRDQVWFVEKDDAGATRLYPLTDFKPRRDENLERGYLQGRYGAVPFLASPVAEPADA